MMFLKDREGKVGAAELFGDHDLLDQVYPGKLPILVAYVRSCTMITVDESAGIYGIGTKT